MPNSGVVDAGEPPLGELEELGAPVGVEHVPPQAHRLGGAGGHADGPPEVVGDDGERGVVQVVRHGRGVHGPPLGSG